MSCEENKILNFQHFSRKDELPGYLVIQFQGPIEPRDQFCLSSQVMDWGQQIYLYNLTPVASYWGFYAQEKGLGVVEFLEEFLKIHFSSRFRGVLADHPWKGLVTLNRIDWGGLISLESQRGENFYAQMSWQDWLEPMEILLSHLVAIGQKIEKDRTYTQIKKFHRFLERSMLVGPLELHQANSDLMGKRFGQVIGMTWEWTWECREEIETGENLGFFSWKSFEAETSGFPWIDLNPQEDMKIQRNLDYPLIDWETISLRLKEDLKKLAEKIVFECYVMELSWNLTLYNLKKISVPVVFRNPHSLHEDGDEFKIALTQFYYSFQRVLQGMSEREDDLDLPEEIPFISWSLKLEQSLVVSLKSQAFFQEVESRTQIKKILKLQNRLPKQIESYQMTEAFCPEHSYGPKKIEHSFEENRTQQWRLAASRRPLYIYEHPVQRERPKSTRGLKFLEKAQNDWWNLNRGESGSRSYYMLLEERKYLWVYEDEQGEWFEQGIFG